MQNRSTVDIRKSVVLTFIVLGLLTALILVPKQFRTEAISDKNTRAGINRTESHVPGLENYDIRTQKSDVVFESMSKFRRESGKSASSLADTRDNFVRGEKALRTKVKSLKVEYNDTVRIPEVITPDVYKKNIERLSGPSSDKNSDILRNFVKQYDGLVGLDRNQIDNLKVTADYTNPSGNMSFAHLAQEINGIPVFTGEIKAGFTTDGEIVRIINNLAPGLDYDSLSTDFGDPLTAVKAAAGHINYKLLSPDVTRNDAASSDTKVVFGNGPSATTAEKMYFPTEVGVARPTWRVLIWQPVNAFYVIVDAETGTMLWRKNITEDQTESATYQVYDNTNAFSLGAESPAPTTPGPIDPSTGTQGPLLTRTDVTLIGNEGANSFNDLGWITDGANGTDGHTDGNNVEAGLDIAGGDGVDAPMLGTGRVFTSAWNPPPGNPGPGDAPGDAVAQFGAVVQMFYATNRYHDTLYTLGFTEEALNFQDSNFAHTGAGGDRIRAEGQDQSGTNNANMSTPADGGRGRMQMYVFTGPARDGTTDVDVILHELTHGTSNRLHSNTAGLSTNHARGMGEGWSDFYAHAMTSEPTDTADGIYTTGAYVTFNSFGLGSTNSYFGIRRFPKAILSSTGGPGNLPHNPLTFADLNSGCDLSDGAFAPPFVGTCDQVHNAGEIWSSALWEVRNLMVTRLGFTAGNTAVLQVVTDGMKMAPVNPTFIQERDAIIAAAAALPRPESGPDVADVKEGFRIRGMGFSAEVLNTSPANVVEAFDFPNVQHIDPFAVSDSTGNNNGFPEPGENVLLSVPVTNTTGGIITNVTANVNGGTNVLYGDISDGVTVTMNIPYTVNGATPCGGFEMVNINASSDVGAQAPVAREFRLGVPVGGAPATFENTTAMLLPGTGTSGPADLYPSPIEVSGLSGNKIMKLNLNSINHTFPDDLDMLLEGPGGNFIFLSDSGSSADLVNDNVTLFDGAVDVAPTGTGLTTGEFQPANYLADDPFDAPAPAGPYANAQTGGSDTFTTVYGTDGAALNGTWNLYIDDDAGLDSGSMPGGWSLTFESDSYSCGPLAAPGDGRADFDGDNRTDISVYRPSEGNWYLNNSTTGFGVIAFGLAGDVIVPGDYDGDGKTDTAIFRATDDPGTPDWWILNSDGFTLSGAQWGLTGDIPLVGDYDGDDKDDIAVWRESDTTWYVLQSTDGMGTLTTVGGAGETPVSGDFDGDGKTDMTFFDAGLWTTNLSGGGTEVVTVGAAGDIPLAGDFDGDGQSDQATFRGSTGSWYIWYSTTDAEVIVPFGASGDIPVPGDYDGDGTDDVAIYRAGDWWINATTSGLSVTAFGLGSDIPVVAGANP